jgi:hypothetical protein
MSVYATNAYPDVLGEMLCNGVDCERCDHADDEDEEDRDDEAT